MNEKFLSDRLSSREAKGLKRELKLIESPVDFCSNDYLGVVRNNLLNVQPGKQRRSGSTGSRLLTGNSPEAVKTESRIADFHEADASLIFNSGYDANIGLISCVAGRGDTILYDYLSHASIRDGIRLSLAVNWSFMHNDLDDLELKLSKARGNIFVVTESVFSMDGDFANLEAMVKLCEQYHANLIVDEAHATGVIGSKGEGLAQSIGIHNRCFARIYTYGKALGCHGASIVGSGQLCEYLVNFCRPFIYTTALSPFSYELIATSYDIFPFLTNERTILNELVAIFSNAQFSFPKLNSNTPIQGVIIPGNENARLVANRIQEAGIDVRPILYPTVPLGSERLRIVLHSFNTSEELERLIRILHDSSM